METFAIRYNPKDIAVSKMLDAITHMKGVEILGKEVLTPEEMKEIEKSRKSGILYDIDKLQAKLNF